MGNSLKKAILNPPVTFSQCFVNNEFDVARYFIYRRRKEESDDAMNMLTQIHLDIQVKKKRKLEDLNVETSKRTRLTYRTVKKYKILIQNDDGTLRELQPIDTMWYHLYLKEPPRNKRVALLFRRRFRLPYQNFLMLLHDISNHPSFQVYMNRDCVGEGLTDISMLLLGALRYLGRSWTFDDVEEATAISRETNRLFFKKFIEYGSSNLFKRYVTDAAKSLSMNELTSLFMQAGFNGCIGSTDATHVPMLKCAAWAHNIHNGSKLHLPSRTYNVTVTHSRQILGSTIGHPGTFNDKTVIMFDRLLADIHNGKLKNEHRFTLLEKDEDNNIVERNYVGAWFIVDNGYLNWSCTVPPMKHALSYKFIRFSDWLESMRKDVECTFGIMKGRFTILKTGIKLQNFELTDQVWLTCCALHNMLLFADGLDQGWEEGHLSYWEKEGLGIDELPGISFAETRLNRIYSEATDVNDESELNESDNLFIELATHNGKRYLNELPLRVFKKLLANHFDIRFRQKTINWPQRLRHKPLDNY